MRYLLRCASTALLATTLAGCAAGVPPAGHRITVPSTSTTTASAPTITTTAPRSTTTPTGQSLPLTADTGSASQVITVVASSTSATTARLREWTRAPGGWQPVGGNITADLGSAGLTTHPSETLPATPIGSFTLTHAFGRDANPGTALPYLQTTPDDWWVSQPGPQYNTHQRCATDCSFDTSNSAGNPNEHLYYEIPYYDYALVIDYNTGPQIEQGAGSAFFLHVSTGAPTQGCISIPVDDLLPLMRWLNPADNPRIVIGLAGRA